MYLASEIIATLVGSCFGAVVGAVSTWLVQMYFRKKDKEDKQKKISILLYNELRHIKSYVENGGPSGNLSYTDEWQKIVSESDFLSASEVQLLFDIFNNAYMYNWNYELNTHHSSKKNIPGHDGLAKCIKKVEFGELVNKLNDKAKTTIKKQRKGIKTWLKKLNFHWK